MKKAILFLVVFFSIFQSLNAQTNIFPSSGSVGIGTNSPSAAALLDISSTTKGFLGPRMTQTQRDAIVSPVAGLLIYQTNNTSGYYYYTGSSWMQLRAPAPNKNLNNLTAPTGVNVELLPLTDNLINLGSATKNWRDIYSTGSFYIDGSKFLTNPNSTSVFVGNTGNASSSGVNNVAVGFEALKLNTSGGGNTAAGSGALTQNSSASNNSAFGFASLISNNGASNTAIGSKTLFSNSTGTDNTASGAFSMVNNGSGISNTANGAYSLFSNAIGSYNTSVGYNSLAQNDASSNTAIGAFSMNENTIGGENTAMGINSLFTNSEGGLNVAIGGDALFSNLTGNKNTSTGYRSMYNNSTGGFNTAFGGFSMTSNQSGSYNTAIGFNSGSSNSANTNCTFLGNSAYEVSAGNLDNSSAIGANSRITASNQIRIGSSTVSSIGGFVNWSNVSDGRFKKNIKEDVSGLDFIRLLRPVTYNLDIDGLNEFLRLENSNDVSLKENEIQSGFIAQEVEQAGREINYKFSGVDAPKNSTDLYGLRYAEFVVPIVKALQELDKTNKELIQKNEALEKTNFATQRQLIELRNELEEAKLIDKKGNTNSFSTYNKLEQNQPNPFTNETLIQYQKEAGSEAVLVVYELNGKKVKEIGLGNENKGEIIIKAGDLKAGTYTYSILINGLAIDTKLMVVGE